MNIQKFGGNNAEGVRQVLAHIARNRPSTAKYGNEAIDSTRTAKNYTLTPQVSSQTRYSRLVEEAKIIHTAFTGKQPRSDAVTLCSLVVQLPHEYCDKHSLVETVDGREKHYTYYTPKDTKQADEFFRVTSHFAMKHFGVPASMLVDITIHLDETTPHMHLAWVPLHGAKLNAKAQVNREKLKSFHQRIDKALKRNLKWYRGGIVSGEISERLKGHENITMDEYRKVKQAVDELRAEYDELSNGVDMARLERGLQEAPAVKMLVRLWTSLQRAGKRLPPTVPKDEVAILEQACRLMGVKGPSSAERSGGRSL